MPHNGAYNLFAGANQFTENYLSNEEDSLPQALAQHGIKTLVPGDCNAPMSRGGVVDVHAPALETFYSQFARQFIEEHPATMVRLMWMKFKAMMYPDFRLYAPGTMGGILKILSALAFPLWVVALIFLPHPGPPPTRFVLAATVAIYIVPFLLTISSPRFRVPLDFLLWVDLGAILSCTMSSASLPLWSRPAAKGGVEA